MTELDLVDSVLDFENQCYEQGFKEGSQVGQKQGFVEGRELGIQTGFQRYLSLGILQARCDQWKQQNAPEKQQKQIQQLDSYIQITDLSNDPAAVESVEMAIKKGKNKSKLLAASLKSPPIVLHDNKIVFTRDDAIEDL